MNRSLVAFSVSFFAVEFIRNEKSKRLCSLFRWFAAAKSCSIDSMSAADIPRVYREVQLMAALRAEKEKALNARRQGIAELHTEAKAAADELHKRQSLVAEQRAVLHKATDAYEMAKAERAAHATQQLQQVAAMDEEAMSLQRRAEALTADTASTIEMVQEARADAARAPGIDEMISKLQQQLLFKETEFDAFEAKLSETERAVRDRHAAVALDGIPVLAATA